MIDTAADTVSLRKDGGTVELELTLAAETTTVQFSINGAADLSTGDTTTLKTDI